VNYWNQRTEVPAKQIVVWLGIGGNKYFDWKKRYGKANEHNGSIPRDHLLVDSERKAILDFHSQNPLEGYRRLTFMMLDADGVAASTSSV
jgi:putative transposase